MVEKHLSATQMHQQRFAEALRYFLDTCPDAVNGIIIWVEHPLISGKMVFEIQGKLPLEEAYGPLRIGGTGRFIGRGPTITASQLSMLGSSPK